ncbi:hypothetical protein O181_113438, partial [Austropuccinia psidii MF-1]|nr:hypothetical protein [Austropuccinia psidii MF-1]
TSLKGPGEDDEEEEENSVEEEESDGTEDAPAPVGEPQGTGRPTLAHSDQPVSHQSKPSLLAIMQQITQIMANPQESSSSESSRPPAFNTPSMKAQGCFDGTQPFKVRIFIQAAKWIEPYLANIINQDPSYLLNSWKLFESQLFTLFGDPKEVRKAEAGLDSLRMKEGWHVSLYISDFRILVSRIRYWGERALIYHFRRGLASRILDQLASHPSNIDCIQHLIDITLELDTRYHKRQKEKTPEASKSNSSSSSHKKKKNFQKRGKPHSFLLNKDFKLMNSEKKEESRRAYVPIVVGSIVLRPVSKGLKTSLPNPPAVFPAMEKPE